jgi:hypothetical protein
LKGISALTDEAGGLGRELGPRRRGDHLSEVGAGLIGTVELQEHAAELESGLDAIGELQLRVLEHGEGAYHSIFKRKLDEICETTSSGRIASYVIENSRMVALTQTLPEGYYVVLVMNRRGSLARARYQLLRTARVMARQF